MTVKIPGWSVAFYTFVLLSGASAHAAEPGDCEKFLARYVPYSEALPQAIPLQKGTLSLSDDHLFLSMAEVTAYISDHPQSPWVADLAAVSNIAQGSLVYISEVGPTLWTNADFSSWQELVNSGLGSDPEAAGDILMAMARGEILEEPSPQSHERLRNAFLASQENTRIRQEGHALKLTDLQAEDQDFIDKFLKPQPPEQVIDPLTGEPFNMSRVPPEDQHHIRILLEDLGHSIRGVRARREILNQAPSLRIDFEFDHRKPLPDDIESPLDLYNITNDTSRLWIGRIVLREALIRRKLVTSPEGKSTTLGQVINEDQIFLLATFPEFAPYWPMLGNWPTQLNYLSLTDPEVDQYELPAFRINQEEDVCYFALHRHEWEEGTIKEPVDLIFEVTTKNEEQHDCNFVEFKEQQRFTAWFNQVWDEYSQLLGQPNEPRPSLAPDDDLSKMELKAGAVSPTRILGFYAFLYGRFTK